MEHIHFVTNNLDDKKKLSGILVDGVSGLVTHIANCCKPLPGDNIIGFITQGRGVAIHRGNCRELKTQARRYPNKVVTVNWGSSSKNGIFRADLEVIANDRSGLLRDLTNLFAMEKIAIAGLSTTCKNNKANMVFSLQIVGGEFNFSWLINKINKLDGVIEVMRK